MSRSFFPRDHVEKTEESRSYDYGGSPGIERRRRAKLRGAHVAAFKSLNLSAKMFKHLVKNSGVERLVRLSTEVLGDQHCRDEFVGVFQDRP